MSIIQLYFIIGYMYYTHIDAAQFTSNYLIRFIICLTNIIKYWKSVPCNNFPAMPRETDRPAYVALQ